MLQYRGLVLVPRLLHRVAPAPANPLRKILSCSASLLVGVVVSFFKIPPPRTPFRNNVLLCLIVLSPPKNQCDRFSLPPTFRCRLQASEQVVVCFPRMAGSIDRMAYESFPFPLPVTLDSMQSPEVHFNCSGVAACPLPSFQRAGAPSLMLPCSSDVLEYQGVPDL